MNADEKIWLKQSGIELIEILKDKLNDSSNHYRNYLIHGTGTIHDCEMKNYI